MVKECDENQKKAKERLIELSEQQNSRVEFKKHIDKIREVLKTAKEEASQNMITKSFVDQYIDKIYATVDNGKIKLDIKIFTGETCCKYLENLRSRTGHISKKMVEAYENNIK